MSGILPPEQEQMNDTKDFKKWGVDQVIDFFNKRGFGQYANNFQQHEITGERITSLTAADLKELGVSLLGHRLEILKEIGRMKTVERKGARSTIIAQHQEAYDGSCWDRNLSTFCGICPLDEDRYTLTSVSLRIREFEVFRLCGIWKITCCGGEWKTDNIPLHRILDVDKAEEIKCCACFAEKKAKIHIQVTAGNEADDEHSRTVDKYMRVEGGEGGEGDTFLQQIRDAIEEYKLKYDKGHGRLS